MSLKLEGQLSLDGSGWERGLADAQAQGTKFAESIQEKLAEAFTIGAIAEMTKSIVEFADKIGDMATRLNVSTDYLQEMNYLLKQNGASADDLVSAFEKLNVARLDALENPTGQQAQAFGKFGINEEQLRTLRPEQLLDAIGRVFKEKGNSPELAAAWRQIGGKGSGILINSFLEGLDEGRAKAKEDGAVISQENLAAIKDAADSFERMTILIKANLAPALKTAIDFLEWAAAQIRESFGFAYSFATNFNLMDAIKSFFAGGGPLDPAGAIQSVLESDNFKKAFNEGSKTVADIEKDYQKQATKEIQTRGERFNPTPQESITTQPPQQAIARQKQSDSLVSVGNFLGQSKAASAIENIANKQLKEAQKQTGYLSQIAKNDKTIKVP